MQGRTILEDLFLHRKLEAGGWRWFRAAEGKLCWWRQKGQGVSHVVTALHWAEDKDEGVNPQEKNVG